MLLSIIVRWLVLAGAVVLTAWLLPGMSIEGGLGSVLLVALLVGLVNVLVSELSEHLPGKDSPVLLGALTLAVNGLLLWLGSALTDRLSIDGFLPAVVAAVLISVFSTVLALVALRLLNKRPDRESVRA